MSRAQKSTPGGVLTLLLLLAVYGSGFGPDGPGEPEEPLTNPVLNAEQSFRYPSNKASIVRDVMDDYSIDSP